MVNCSYQVIPQFSIICIKVNIYFFAVMLMILMFMKVCREKLIQEAFGNCLRSVKKLENPQDIMSYLKQLGSKEKKFTRKPLSILKNV